MGLGTCELHNWILDEEGCPVCEGMKIVKERVRELLKQNAEYGYLDIPVEAIEKALDGEK